jgi:hypothetical protein
MKKLMILFSAWIVLTGISVYIGIKIIDPDRDYNLASKGTSTRGHITAIEPNNHRSVHYVYTVGNNTYSGVGHGGAGNPDFEYLAVGQDVMVFYDPSNPQDSILGYPEQHFSVDIGGVIFVAIVLPLFVMYGLYRKGLFTLLNQKKHPYP